MEVPRLEVQLELQLLAYTTDEPHLHPHHSSQQCQILNPLFRGVTVDFTNVKIPWRPLHTPKPMQC